MVGVALDTGWHDAWALVYRKRVGELLYNTLRLIIGCTLLSACVGVGGAWLVERTDLPGRRIWTALLVAPLAIPAFVNSFGWVSITARVENFWGALLIVTLSYYPFVFLPAAAALRGLDPALEETAQSLGHSRLVTFFRVVLPQLRPAVVGGSLLVGLHLLSEFGALQMLRFPTFTTGIYDQFQSSFNSPAANMLSTVLVLLCLILLVLELRLAGSRRYSRVGSGVKASIERHRLGWWALPALMTLTIFCTLALGVPIGSLIYWSTVGTSTAFPYGDIVRAVATTVGLGLAGALLTTLAAFPVAWLSVRHRGALSTLIERSTYIAAALPGVVVALSLVSAAIHHAEPVYQTVTLLVIAYMVLFIPRAVVSAKAALKQAPPVLDDVAHALGAGRFTTIRRVTLPLVAPGLGAGAALVFLAIVTELTATLLLAPIGTNTLATEFWNYSSSIEYGAAAPFAMLMVLISIPATYLLMHSSKAVSDS